MSLVVFVLQLVFVAVHAALELDGVVDVVELVHNVLPRGDVEVISTLLAVDELKVHASRVVVALLFIHLDFSVKTWLDILAVDLKEHLLEHVGFVVSAHVRWVDIDVD